jgi:hypothetical protein
MTLLCVSFSRAQVQSISALFDIQISPIQDALNLSAQTPKLLGTVPNYQLNR